jgi:membrane protein DedA with SNARE-associated domain
MSEKRTFFLSNNPSYKIYEFGDVLSFNKAYDLIITLSFIVIVVAVVTILLIVFWRKITNSTKN